MKITFAHLLLAISFIEFSLCLYRKSPPSAEENDEIQPLSSHGAFISSFFSTIASELGDRTFILTTMLSTKYNRKWVFVGCFGAFFLTNIISCLIGNISEMFISKHYMKIVAALLFLFFGIKSLYELVTNTVDDEDDEAEEDLKIIENKLASRNKEGEQLSKQKEKISKTSGPAIALLTFTQNFFGEFGDSSQITTVAMSASFSFWKVFFGSTTAQICCTLLALIGGKVMAKTFSERTMALVSGVLFVGYGIGTFFTLQ